MFAIFENVEDAVDATKDEAESACRVALANELIVKTADVSIGTYHEACSQTDMWVCVGPGPGIPRTSFWSAAEDFVNAVGKIRAALAVRAAFAQHVGW